MTREELRDYVDEQFNNIPYHVYSALIDGIDTLEQEPVLDEIRAEIRANSFYVTPQYGRIIREADVLHIIDKYKAETEEDFIDECKRLDGDCGKCSHKHNCCSSEYNGRH